LFDAVNEFAHHKEILTKLADFVRSINVQSVKVLITCRIPIWNTIKRHFTVPTSREFHTAGPNSYVNIEVFNDQELTDVYTKYKTTYQLTTDFDDLPERVKQFVTQPLFLKLMAVAYRGKSIPASLGLEDVFNEYIAYCVAKEQREDPNFDLQSTPEYNVLRRAVELMFETAKRELEIQMLRQDNTVGRFIELNLDVVTPYTNLISEGILSQRIDEVLMKKIEIVFVTYERVFEYLLADIVIGNVSVQRIISILDAAKGQSFAQLRGAAELAVSFALINDRISIRTISELADIDRPESRQFLTDVIQTVYLSGHRDLSNEIIEELITNDSHAANLLAIQAAYQLKLDTYLVRVSMSKNDDIREIAMMFLYQRWNRARLDGQLNDGYKPIFDIVDKIKLRRPGQSWQALSALISISTSLMSHIIDDKESMIPLVDIWQGIIRKVPGLVPSPTKTAANVMMDTLIGLVARAAKIFIDNTIFFDKQALNDLWSSPRTKRIMLDYPFYVDADNLSQHKSELKAIFEHENFLVIYLSPVITIFHLFHNPDENLAVMQEIFFGETKYPCRTKYWVTHALVHAAVCRLMRGLEMNPDFIETIEDNVIEVWELAWKIDATTGQTTYEKEGYLASQFSELLLLLFWGVFNIEAVYQRAQGYVTGSSFLTRFLSTVDITTERDAQFLLKCLERFAYQGTPDFAIKTMLEKNFRRVWQNHAERMGIDTISNLRAFYQDEIDSLLIEGSEAEKILLSKVRMSASLPKVADVLFTNANLWVVSACIEPILTKACANVLVNLVSAKSINEFIVDLAKTLIYCLYDYDVVNLLCVELFRAHNPKWDNAQKWGINLEALSHKTELQQYWRQEVQSLVAKYGMGQLHSGDSPQSND
jgi:hypothetical protein